MTAAFLEALRADGPAADRAERMQLYGWLVGSWDIDVTEFRHDGSTRRRPGEWHFGWALEGRAIQDVSCRRGHRHGDAVAQSNRCGTTLRVYDPRIDAWQIQWSDPVSQTYLTMVGRREGEDIMQLGKNAEGNLARWSFRDIALDSFLWRGEVSRDAGVTWRTVVEFTARRAGVGG